MQLIGSNKSQLRDLSSVLSHNGLIVDQLALAPRRGDSFSGAVSALM
jgi:hypothetical protein